MDFSELKKIIPNEEWWSEECPVKWQYCYWAYSFVEQRAYFHPDFLSVCMVAIKDGFGQEKTSVREKLAIYDWMRDRHHDDHSYFDKEYERWVVVRSALDGLSNIIVHQAAGWGIEELRANYNRLLPLAIDSTRWGAMIEGTDPYSERVVPGLLKEALPDLTDEERNRINITLSTPLIVSFMEEFELAKLHIISEYREQILAAASWEEVGVSSALGVRVEELRMSYRWLSVNYAGSDPLSCADLFTQLRDDARSRSAEQLAQAISDLETKIERTQAEQVEYLERYQVPQDLLDHFSLMRQVGRWMDERKETMVRTNLALWEILRAIAEKTGVPKAQLEWYTPQEIDALLAASERVNKEEIELRMSNSVFVTVYDGDGGSELTIFVEDEATELYGLLNSTSSEVLTGMVAARAKDESKSFTGKVQVVLDGAKDDFIPGNILVTTMTRPDFVPLLKKAAAIITDEGGVTCHAAVVSRELGIPCIIGTRHATKQLKDGDVVEMDLESGEVRLS